MPGVASESRMASAWALVQFLSGVWAGVLGANSPFLHGLVAGLPALVLGLVLPSPLPAQFVVVAWRSRPVCRSVAFARGESMRIHARQAQTPLQDRCPFSRRRSCVASPNFSS